MMKDNCYICQTQGTLFFGGRRAVISDNLNTFSTEVSKIVTRSNHITHNPSINSLNIKYLECYIAIMGLS